MITLDEAKAYLRIDSAAEDPLITSLISASEHLAADVARLTKEEKDRLLDSNADDEDAAEIRRTRETLRVASLYALGYLFEHREEADHHDLDMTLRAILFAIREGRSF